jgi:asparagine synthase (glutamine-hydrolysing)
MIVCGMTGWVDFGRNLLSEQSTIRRMTDCLSHRGPDASGIWLTHDVALGHCRLAVIDVEGGQQPMVHREAGEDIACLVFTGEVYNFQDLRSELMSRGHSFTTRSDTEVVLRGYLEWGVEVAGRLNGMYAFAVWDTRTRELLLVRDRLGIKPLYYCNVSGSLLFGSEPKAIFASGLVEPVVDAEGLCELLSLVRTPGLAVFRGMQEIKPGHVVRVNREGLSTRTYWTLEAREHLDNLPTTIDTLRELLDDITRRQLVADVPLCTLLSGGLDSTLITALAQRHRQRTGKERLRSFTVGFASPNAAHEADRISGASDLSHARHVANDLGTEHSGIVLSTDELASVQVSSAAMMARDLPPHGDMDNALYLMCKAIREHSTVALSGEGADEIFGGYVWFHDADAVAADTFPWLAAAARLGRQAVFEPRLSRGLNVAAYQADRYREALAGTPRLVREDGLERRMREINYLHLTRFLPNPLDRKDRMSMAVGLEIRVPYCDHRLVQYVFNVPWAMKTFDGREKSLLRAVARDAVPDLVLRREKAPFPTTPDPAYHAHLRDAVSDLLAAEAPVLSILSRPTVRALAAMPATGARIVRLGLERILRLNQWLERYRVRVAI